ncbi:MAG: peptidyl-prolyl cis-trans isomerase [Gammaproteobacteria bacterium]|nr:peptidyl-prolyl cis-trans isomerase [Gammaproteobacteria bacterium]
MKTDILRLWREPLLHFLLIGAALFVFYDLTGESIEEPPKRIQVNQGQVQQLASAFERTWSRAPTVQELDAMVEGHIREEVFYREALAMGLDRDDPLVRRRLRMKLEFMLDDLAAQDVDDSVLFTYLKKNADSFRTETQLTFSQVYLNPDQHPNLEADAAKLLSRLNDGADPAELGDATLAPRFYQLAGQNEIARDFGDEFAGEVAALQTGDWTGPVWSPFGAHLIRIEARIDTQLLALAEVRDRVLREYHAEQSKLQKDLAYQKLRETYDITIESLDAGDNSNAAMVSEAKAGETQ